MRIPTSSGEYRQPDVTSLTLRIGSIVDTNYGKGIVEGATLGHLGLSLRVSLDTFGGGMDIPVEQVRILGHVNTRATGIPRKTRKTRKTRTRPECPGCSGEGRKTPECKGVAGVFQCSECGGIFGNVASYGETTKIVSSRIGSGPNGRYFDFTYKIGLGTGRRHGWYDPATGLMTQVG